MITIFPLYLPLVRPHMDYTIDLWAPYFRRDAFRHLKSWLKEEVKGRRLNCYQGCGRRPRVCRPSPPPQSLCIFIDWLIDWFSDTRVKCCQKSVGTTKTCSLDFWSWEGTDELRTFSRKEMKGFGRAESRVQHIEGYMRRRMEVVQLNAMVLSKSVTLFSIFTIIYFPFKPTCWGSSAFALVKKMPQHHDLYPFLSLHTCWSWTNLLSLDSSHH